MARCHQRNLFFFFIWVNWPFYMDFVIKVEIVNSNLHLQPKPPAYTHLSKSGSDMNWDWRGNTEGDTTLGEKVDRKHHRQRNFPEGTTSWKKKRWMMITWKCSFTCNTLAACPQGSNCGLREKFLPSENNAVFCVYKEQTALSKWRKLRDWTVHTVYLM